MFWNGAPGRTMGTGTESRKAPSRSASSVLCGSVWTGWDVDTAVGMVTTTPHSQLRALSFGDFVVRSLTRRPLLIVINQPLETSTRGSSPSTFREVVTAEIEPSRAQALGLWRRPADEHELGVHKDTGSNVDTISKNALREALRFPPLPLKTDSPGSLPRSSPSVNMYFIVGSLYKSA